MNTAHNIIGELGPYPFKGTARGCRNENPAAHGGTMLIEVRDDGARRQVNSNGGHKEHGRWFSYTGEISLSGVMAWHFVD